LPRSARRRRPPPPPAAEEGRRASGGRATHLALGAVCGAVAALAMTLVWAVFRLAFDVVSLPEMLGDRVAERIPVGPFLDLIGRFGSYDRLKALSVAATVAGAVAVGAALGAAYAAGARRQAGDGAGDGAGGGPPARRPVLALVAAVALAWAASVAALWPLLGSYFHGEDRTTAAAATAASLLLSYVVFATVLVLAHRLVTGVARPPTGAAAGLGRRALLAGGVGVGLGAVTGGLVGRLAERSTFGYDGQQVFGDLEPYTPNDRFYVVTQNLIDPDVRRDAWRLRIEGEVERPRTYDFAAISAMEAVLQDTTLCCISNGVGGGLMSNAAWKGVPLAALLADAQPRPGVRDVVFRGVDGYTDTFALDKAMEWTTLVAYEMNGRPLPRRHGYPARIIVPGLYGEKNVKWVEGITLSASEEEGFYERQGWGPDFTVQTQSRFSTDFSRPLPGGLITLRGSAFAGDRGVSRVEVSVDDGVTWQPADITYAGTRLTWSLWSFLWSPSRAGEHRLAVRAYDGAGAPQVARARPIEPEGATGYHRVTAFTTVLS